uniref:Uncharacterized protein n=1 Tax=Oryza rufipogon TaxID=4529 RepID=A0A0E0QGH7_ORYRU
MAHRRRRNRQWRQRPEVKKTVPISALSAPLPGILEGFEEDFKEKIGRNDDENPTAALGVHSGATMARSVFPTIHYTK